MMKRILYIRLLILCLLVPAPLLGGERSNILIVNANRSVEKYRVAQVAFQKTLTAPVTAIDLGSLPEKASRAELFSQASYDLIYCIGAQAYLEASRNAPDTRILFSSILNWMRLPLNKKAYGVSNELHSAMQIMLIRYVFPDIKRIGVIYSDRFNRQWFHASKEDASKMEIELIGRPVFTVRDVEPTLRNLLTQVDAFWLIADPLIVSGEKQITQIFTRCDQEQIPVITYSSLFAKYGATLVLSVDNPTIGRQAAGIAQALLDGKDLKERVQSPAGTHIILNMKKVKLYRLNFSDDALGAVNQIIE
jgi:putative ABC transport system substrate-binding protein